MRKQSLVQINQRYGRLLVVRKAAVKKWECICDCGKVVTRGSVALLHGETESCGCLRIERMTKLNLIGQRYGRLTVIEEAERTSPLARRWHCLCDCGNEKDVDHQNLRGGGVRSCGCWQAEHRATISRIAKKTQNGLSGHLLFATWRNMMDRCYKAQRADYKNYGGRGIAVCGRWHQFENFIADMGEKPFPKATIERKDNNGNYCPENCAWATRTVQTRNKRNTRIVTFEGKECPLAELAERFDIPVRNLRERLDRYGWTLLRALTAPILAPSEAAKFQGAAK